MAVIEMQSIENRRSVSDRLASTEQEVLSHEVLQHFRILFSALRRHAQWGEKQGGLSAAQRCGLWKIAETPGLHVGELACALNIHQSTSSSLIDKLEKDQLVRKERNADDQRLVSLYLTGAGDQVVREMPRPTRGTLQETLSRLPRAFLRRLDDDLNALIAHLEIVGEQSPFTPLAHLLRQEAARIRTR